MDILKEIEQQRGHGTSMVTLFLPSDFNLWLAVDRLKHELSQAGNIKSKKNRKSIQAALRSGLHHIKALKNKWLSKGLAIFVSENLYTCIEPPIPIKKYLYYCDKRFHPEGLYPLYEKQEDNAVLFISGKSRRLYTFNEHQMVLVKSKKISLQKHHKKGGQSQNRIQRLADESHFNYISSALAELDRELVVAGIAKVKNLIIVGPAAKKKDLVKRLSGPLRSILVAIVTTHEQITDSALQELALGYVYAEEIKKERKIEQQIYDVISRCDEDVELLCFGLDNILRESDEYLLKRIIVDKKLIQDKIFDPDQVPDNCQLIILTFASETFRKSYGGIVGIRYFIQ